ncbi:hypothetical protein O5D80_000761 [Batrachochytrium dendrobatidis]|nr:hypothetical protein O5D80_000761 [Batrachochytrium dendrobatidis]
MTDYDTAQRDESEYDTKESDVFSSNAQTLGNTQGRASVGFKDQVDGTRTSATAWSQSQSKFKKDAGSFVSEDTDFLLAKSFMNTVPNGKTFSLYDHLATIVNHVLQTRSPVALDNFETLSADLKRNRFRTELPGAPTSLRETIFPSGKTELAKKRAGLFYRQTPEEAAEKASTDIGEIPDIMDLANLWEWAGVSFGKEETFVLFLSIKKLVEEKPLKSVRLWGKVFGTHGNYIIVEAEIKEGSADEDDAIANAPPISNAEMTEPISAKDSDGQEKPDTKNKLAEEAEIGLPKPKTKPVKPLTKEVRVGVNKYVYYTTPFAGGPWTRLPDVIPELLQASRKIHKYFTGNLSAHISSYPAFPGTESHYLRAQIARISSATVLSPNGYYMVDAEEAEGEESQNGASIIINPEFEGFPNDQLMNLTNWVHHVPYILPQGKVGWENPTARVESAEGDDEQRDDEDAGDEGGDETVEPETGPALLTAISGDEDHGEIPSWSSRVCSNLSPSKFSPVMLRSNRWPGAVVVAYNDKFANIYIGDGIKDLGHTSHRFVPPRLGDIQREYSAGENTEENTDPLNEQLDPTVEQEKEFDDEKKSKDLVGKKDGSDNEDNADEEAEED